jgi:dihydrofolate reductase
VATSLDGFIAGPQGELDWILSDPAVDFAALYAQFDTVLLGRRTYELTRQPGAPAWPRGWRVFVFSRSLEPAGHPGVTIVKDDVEQTVAALRAEAGRDIWLFGGGRLCSSLLSLRLVDTIELAVMPVLLGSGVPLADALARPARLTLTHADSSPTGIVNLRYEVTDAAG